MRHMIGGLAGLAAIGLAVSMPAMANMPAGTIPAFNQAVQSGDAAVIVAAARQFGATAIAHPEDPQAAVAAFEAANQLCLRGACAEAVPMADFAATRAAALPVTPEQAEILQAYARWSSGRKNGDDDAAFEDVLRRDVADPPSLLSAAAYEAFYLDVSHSTDWGTVLSRASLAAEHLRPARDALAARWATAELLSATADYNYRESIGALEKIGDLELWLYDKQTGDETNRIDRLYYETWAWRAALAAAFRSFDHMNLMRARKVELHVEEAKRMNRKMFWREGPRREPLCSGRIVERPDVDYPTWAAKRGYVGAVLVAFDFAEGKPGNFRVVGSVPGNDFDREALESMQSVRWEFDAKQANPSCSGSSDTPSLYAITFIMR